MFRLAVIVFACSIEYLQAISFRPICHVQVGVYHLRVDKNSREIVGGGDTPFYDDRALTETTTSFRGASTTSLEWKLKDAEWMPGIKMSDRRLNLVEVEEMQTSDEEGNIVVVPVHKCGCGWQHQDEYEPVFCPVFIKYCGVPRGSANTGQLGCLNANEKRDYARNSLFVTIVWCGLLLACIFCSVPGRHCRDYLLSFCVPGWNQWIAGRIERRDPVRAQMMVRRNMYLRRLILERRLQTLVPEFFLEAQAVAALTMGITRETDEDEEKPISLSLKTRLFQADEKETKSGDAEDEDDEDPACIICYSDIATGERVGDLTCGHTFHVGCLKTWLVRRNICPLCQASNVATPCFGDKAEASSSIAGAESTEMVQGEENAAAGDSEGTTANGTLEPTRLP